MKCWLEGLPDNLTDLSPTDRKRYTLYHARIQKQITKNMAGLLWLAKNRPDVFLDQVVGTIRKQDQPRHKRIQNLLLTIKILKPQFDVYMEVSKDIEEMIE